MKFKDLMAEDAAVIFDVEEFAEYIIIDGVILRASINLNTAPISNALNRQFDGLYGDYSTIFFKTADYCTKRERIPRQGEYIYLEVHGERKRYEVSSCEDDLGVTCLVVSTYRQNTLRQVSMRN